MESPYFYLIIAVVVAKPAVHSGEEGPKPNVAPFAISPRVILRDRNKLWPYGIVPYSFAPGQFEEKYQANILQAMRNIEDVFKDHGFQDESCQVKFVPHTDPEKDLSYIELINKIGCHSPVGRIGGRQAVSINIKICGWHVPTIMHELCHVLGFNHEHQSPYRDKYVKIIPENAQPNQTSNFKKLNESKYTDGGVKYDAKSLMHYYNDAFGKPVEGKKDSFLPTIVAIDPKIVLPTRHHANNKLSRGDWIKLHLLYCPKHIKVLPEQNLVWVEYNSTNGLYWWNMTIHEP